MEKSTPAEEMREANLYAEDQLHHLLEPRHFDELVQLTVNTCLRAPLPEIETQKPEGEARVVAWLGARGIKTAFEFKEDSFISSIHKIQNTYAPITDKNDYPGTYNKSFVVEIESPLRHPASFSNAFEKNVVEKAEQLGQQLMHESIHVLGQDAWQKIEELKRASTYEEKVAVVDWLEARMYAITRTYDAELAVAPEDRFYHPARISPKLIGSYPNIAVAPTCQSVSIIAAGFFDKAGYKTMHASVNTTSNEDDTKSGLTFIENLRASLPRKSGLTIPHRVDESLENVTAHVKKSLYRPEASHAAVYVELEENKWHQFDPNYGATTAIQFEDTNEILDETYAALQDMKSLVPNLEISVKLNEGIAEGRMNKHLFEEVEFDNTPKLYAEAIRTLQENNPESFAQRVYERTVETFFHEDNFKNSKLSAYLDIIKNTLMYQPEGRSEPQLDHFYHKLFTKYVLWDDSIETVLERCAKDRNYLLNRAEDITLIPYLMMASMSMNVLSLPIYAYAHPAIELGNTATRIGLSTLSDFAVHTNSPLPASFWISNWPSSIPPLEYIDKSKDSISDNSLIKANLIHRDLHPLTPFKNYSIVDTFLRGKFDESSESPK